MLSHTICLGAYCAVRNIGDTSTGTAQSGGEPERGGGPPRSVGSVGRVEPLRYVLCKREGLPRERSSAGDSVAILPRCGGGLPLDDIPLIRDPEVRKNIAMHVDWRIISGQDAQEERRGVGVPLLIAWRHRTDVGGDVTTTASAFSLSTGPPAPRLRSRRGSRAVIDPYHARPPRVCATPRDGGFLRGGCVRSCGEESCP